MVLPWRRRRLEHRAGHKSSSDDSEGIKIMMPPNFRCPISLQLMKDPVMISSGVTYDRESIERWMDSSSSSSGDKRCPVTNQVLETFHPVPNHALRVMIQDWCVEHGLERVPTPRLVVNPRSIAEACASIEGATRRGDGEKCRELTAKIKNWLQESVRSKRCLVESGAVPALARCFERFADSSGPKHTVLLEEVLFLLTLLSPAGTEGELSGMGSITSLRCLVEFLKSGNPTARQNAAVLMKETLSSDKRYAHVFVEIEGAIDGLVNLLRNSGTSQITITKASLMATYYVISSSATNDGIISRFLEMGLVSSVVERILETEKGVCEKALCVLDVICESKRGRDEVRQNALVIPLLVKKILRVSDLATLSAVSIIWKLFREEDEDVRIGKSGVLVEAFRYGGFDKLLVLLQIGCGDETKEKTSELLKFMNTQKSQLDSECVDASMEFKHVKRPF